MYIYLYIYKTYIDLALVWGPTCYQVLLHPSCRCICHGQRHKNGLARHCRSLGLERRRHPIQSFASLTAAKKLFIHSSGLCFFWFAAMFTVYFKAGMGQTWKQKNLGTAGWHGPLHPVCFVGFVSDPSRWLLMAIWWVVGLRSCAVDQRLSSTCLHCIRWIEVQNNDITCYTHPKMTIWSQGALWLSKPIPNDMTFNQCGHMGILKYFRQ